LVVKLHWFIRSPQLLYKYIRIDCTRTVSNYSERITGWWSFFMNDLLVVCLCLCVCLWHEL